MKNWLKKENIRLEKENERLRSLLFSTKKDKTLQVSSYYHDKLKEMKKNSIIVNVYYNKDEHGNIEYDFEQIRKDFEDKLLKLKD
tara:strand:+ start:218 stop:472 length:255 start_codon:yes stop_codon:yes gene_type:complete